MLKLQKGITTQMLDQYLWLIGQWEGEKGPDQSKKKTDNERRIKLIETINRAKADSTNEITQLFGGPTGLPMMM